MGASPKPHHIIFPTSYGCLQYDCGLHVGWGKKWMEKTRLGEDNLAVRVKMITFAN
jgi:hypothetical protein